MRNPINSIKKRLARLQSFPAVGSRGGALFLLDPQNWIDNRILAGVDYENKQLSKAKKLIAEYNVTIVVDIGANIGIYTIILGMESTVEMILAFEPVRRNYNQLLGNIFINRLDDKVRAHRVALGSAKGEAIIHIDPKSTNISRLEIGTADRDPSVFRQTETVVLERFDDIAPIVGRRVFVKIDVEGQAVEVIGGMKTFLERNKGVMQIEISRSESAVTDLLAESSWVPIDAIGVDHYFAKR